jgi:hypothetical protein
MGENPIAADQCDAGDCRPHPGQPPFALRLAYDGVVGGHDGGFHHFRDALHVAVVVVAFDVRKGAYRYRRGRIAPGVASHAVANSYQTFASEGGILVVAAHVSDIRHCGGI